MKQFFHAFLVVPLLAAAGSSGAYAQDAPARSAEQPLRVFIDCNFCDMDFIRREMTWVDYMRDRADAQVHVLESSQATGGGGRRFQLEFIGLRDFAGLTDTLFYTATSEDTDDIRRRGLARTIQIGLLRYVANTPLASRLSITLAQPGATPGAARTQPAAAPQDDPWNFWTFRVSLSGNMDGESTREGYRVASSLNASRLTNEWKLNFTVSGNYSEQKFTYCVENCTSLDFSLQRDTTTVSFTRNYSANTLTVKSFGPHLSIGARTTLSTSTFGNTSLAINVSPAIEYSLFPYAESSTRSLTAMYSAGVRHFQYRDTTIFDQIEETRPAHNLSVGYGTRRPWGQVSGSVGVSQYLHDTSKYNVSLFGGVSEIRLFRGFSFNMFGQYTRVRDQIALPKGTRTVEQVLLRQREIRTNYRYFFNAGISYRFGSIFSNIVNPRFGGGGEFFF